MRSLNYQAQIEIKVLRKKSLLKKFGTKHRIKYTMKSFKYK